MSERTYSGIILFSNGNTLGWGDRFKTKKEAAEHIFEQWKKNHEHLQRCAQRKVQLVQGRIRVEIENNGGPSAGEIPLDTKKTIENLTTKGTARVGSEILYIVFQGP